MSFPAFRLELCSFCTLIRNRVKRKHTVPFISRKKRSYACCICSLYLLFSSAILLLFTIFLRLATFLCNNAVYSALLNYTDNNFLPAQIPGSISSAYCNRKFMIPIVKRTIHIFPCDVPAHPYCRPFSGALVTSSVSMNASINVNPIPARSHSCRVV